MRTLPPLWDNRRVKCRLCGGRKGMGVPDATMSSTIMQLDSFVWTVKFSPSWNATECCWVDLADEALLESALDYDEELLICRRALHIAFLSCHRVTNHGAAVHLHRLFSVPVVDVKTAHAQATQWRLVFRCYWFGSTQPVLFNLSSNMSSRKAGTAAVD